jgi:hypothetical protein
VTRGQAAAYKAVQALAQGHAPLLAGLREQAVTTSVALQLAQWTRPIPSPRLVKARALPHRLCWR